MEQRRLDLSVSVREVDDQVRDADQHRSDTAPLDTLWDPFLLRMREYGREKDEHSAAKRDPNEAG